MKLLFTDIDGVFNSKASRRKTRREGILPDAVRMFDAFILAHDIHAVLTTEQRRYTALDELLAILGTTQPSRFIGVTPIMGSVHNKSVEIEHWFRDRPAMQGVPYAILDDRPLLYALADIKRRLVTVDAHVGLQEDQLVKLLAILSPIDDTAPIL